VRRPLEEKEEYLLEMLSDELQSEFRLSFNR
jgi:hypothetical protein